MRALGSSLKDAIGAVGRGLRVVGFPVQSYVSRQAVDEVDVNGNFLVADLID